MPDHPNINLRADGAIRQARSLFQAGDGGSTPTSAHNLRFRKIRLSKAKRLNRVWHSRFPENGGGGSRVCYGAEYDYAWYATAIWTNPTSPKLPQLTWLMLKRFAIAAVRPANTASRMMGWMIRDIRRRFPLVQMLVSYSDPETHEGTIYRSTGWTRDGSTRRGGHMWHNRGRDHTANEPCRSVVRWLYPLWIGPFSREQMEAM